MTPHHFMRLGIHSEQQYFGAGFRDCYDAVVLNGNLVAYTLDGVCSFMSSVLNDKAYFIDPITHAFGHDPLYISRQQPGGDREVRPAIAELAREYGQPVGAIVGIRPIEPDDFVGPARTEFTGRVLDFQRGILERGFADAGTAKYFSDSHKHLPCLLVAPYFYMGSNSLPRWIDLNLDLARVACEIEKVLPVFAEVLIANDAFIDRDARSLVLEKYRESPATGIVLWVESFSEHSASKAVLKGYRDFVSELAKSGKQVIVMYGGFYSVMLQKHGVTGVCHGPGYGESREVTPVGGGMPKPNFYYPDMHTRLSFAQVAFALRRQGIRSVEQYFRDVCDCDMCKQVIGPDFRNLLRRYGETKVGFRRDGLPFEYSTTDAKKLLTAHFIYNKRREFDIVAGADIAALQGQLTESYNRSKGLFGSNEAAHLEAWRDALV
jgi:hypothetical protein